MGENNMQQFTETFNYLSGFSSFWLGLGFTTASAMFIGGILYNGDIPQARKGLVGLLTYFFILLWMGLDRVNVALRTNQYHDITRVYAPTITLIMVTVCYVIGVFLGVYIVSLKHKKL